MVVKAPKWSDVSVEDIVISDKRVGKAIMFLLKNKDGSDVTFMGPKHVVPFDIKVKQSSYGSELCSDCVDLNAPGMDTFQDFLDDLDDHGKKLYNEKASETAGMKPVEAAEWKYRWNLCKREHDKYGFSWKPKIWYDLVPEGNIPAEYQNSDDPPIGKMTARFFDCHGNSVQKDFEYCIPRGSTVMGIYKLYAIYDIQGGKMGLSWSTTAMCVKGGSSVEESPFQLSDEDIKDMDVEKPEVQPPTTDTDFTNEALDEFKSILPPPAKKIKTSEE